MKAGKIITAALASAGLAAAFAVSAYAEADVVSVSVDNALVAFDQNPIIIGEGYTMVPIRAVFEQAGATVEWDQDTQTATISSGGNIVTIKYGDTYMYKNGVGIALDAPAMMESNRILIPVRAISEAMDYSVTWDGQHSLVLISTTGKPYRAHAFTKKGFRTLEDYADYYCNGTAGEAVDLDGDGTAENITFHSTDDISELPEGVLTINGMDYTAGLGSLTSVHSIAVADLDTGDDTKEIIVTENGDVLTAHFYRYDNGILKVIYDSTGTAPAEVTYASKLLLSGTGYIISDLHGTCFVDIMVTGGIYEYQASETNSEVKCVKLKTFGALDSIYGRNLYRTYEDSMLYHVIYTQNYTAGSYKDITDTGIVNSNDIDNFKVLDGYLDKEDKTYIELYVEFSNGERAVIKPYTI